MQLKEIGIPNISDIEWIDPPKSEAIKSAMQELKDLGAVDETEKITLTGRSMALLPVEPMYSKLIITALLNKDFHSILSDIVSIVAMISSQHVFYTHTVLISFSQHRLKKTKLQGRLLKARVAIISLC